MRRDVLELGGKAAIASIAALLLSAPAAAHAQDYKDWDIDEARRECAADPYIAACAPLRRRCIEAHQYLDVERRAVCAELGIDSAGHARRLIEQARAYCTDDDGRRADCTPLRDACEDGPPSCDRVVELSCTSKSDGYCDRETLCATDSIARLCDIPDEPGVAVSLAHVMVRYRNVSGDVLDGHIAALGASVRGSNRSPLGMAYAADAEAGWYSNGNGAAYEANLMLGLAVTFGHHAEWGVLVGGGLSGIHDGHVPFGWVASGEVFAAANTGSVKLLLYARPSRIYKSDPRLDGAPSLDFADELNAGLVFTRATDRAKAGALRALGWSVELVYREALGERWLGVGVGLGHTKWPAPSGN